MTLNRLLLVFCCISIGSVSSQTTTAFRMNYDIANMDIPSNAIESQTLGNYVFAGINLNFLPIVGTITEIGSSGSVLWSKQYSGGLSYQLNDIKKDGTSGYYTCGGSSASSGIFLRVDNTGAYVDANRFDLTNADGEYLSRIVKTTDGGYVAAGYSYGFDPDGAGALPKNDSATAMVVKFDASGNHLWHHVLRFYSDAAMTNPILNDGYFVDVVEVSDGYIFVGSYEVDDVINVDSDGNDLTPDDALFLKTNLAGVITYCKQIDAPSTLSTQPSRNLTSISKTAAGLPLISGSDATGRPLLVMRLPGSGGWTAPTWIRKYGAGNFLGTYYPFVPSRFFETSDGNYAMMGMYIVPLGAWSQFTMKITPATYTPIWSKLYDFSLAVILPQGGQVSDNGFLSLSTVMGGTGFDYHVIKTDPNGVAPAACAETTISPSNATVSYTWGDPFYTDFNANTFNNANITPTITPITPVSSVQCLTIITPCTPPAAATSVVATPATICSGQSSTITASGPATNVTYNVYTAATAGTNLGAAPLVVSPLITTTYYIETVDNTNPTCVSTTRTAVTITVNASPTAPIIGAITQPSCSVATGSVALSGLPASGTWTVTTTPGALTTTGTGTTTTIAGLTAGTTYTFTVTNAAGCTSPASANAVINAAPTTPTAPIIGAITQPTCSVPTGSVALSGLPASGTWTVTSTPGALTTTGTGTTTTFAGLNAGTTYTFTVTNSDGCTSPASTNAAIGTAPGAPTAPIIGAITQPTCSVSTGSVALSGLPASGTWTVTSTPGALTTTGTGTTTTFAGLTAGTTYTFTVTNASGCTSPASTNAVINVAPTTPTAPIIGAITQPTCSVSTGSVALSGLPASGTWTVTSSPGALTTTGTGTTTTFAGLTAGTTYTFTVTNSDGCTSPASTNAVIGTVPGAPTAPIIGAITQPTCSVSTGSVDLSGLPASGTWTVTSSPGALTTTGTGTTTTFAGLTAGTTYTFTVTNSTACTSPASTNAVINAAPTTPTAPIIGAITQPTCSVSTGSVALSGLPASGTWTVTSTPGALTTTGTGTTTTFAGLTASTTYTFTVTNASGCTSPASANAVIDPIPTPPSDPTATVTSQPTCASPTGSITISAPLNVNYEYSINGVVYQAGTVFSGLTPGSYSVTVQDITTACVSTGVVTLVVDPVFGAPTITVLTQIDVTCNGDNDGSASINASGGVAPYTYLWSPAGGNSDFATNLAVGNYTVTVTDDAGCSSIENITIDTPDLLIVGGVETNILCSTATSGTITTNATGGTGSITYSWNPTGEISSSITNLAAGNYSVTITDQNGCSATENYTLTTTGDLPVTVTPSNTTINGGESVILVATGGTTYSWSPTTGLSCPTCATTTASPLSTTTYIVIVSDDYGCFGQDTALVQVNFTCGDIFVPTVFAPSDGGATANNTLCVFGNCIAELNYAVYNRWGEKVFETTDATICWDGTYKGKPLNSGVFAYKLAVTLLDGTSILESGNVTLIR